MHHLDIAKNEWINFNGDWSGRVEVVWNNGKDIVGILGDVLIRLAETVVRQRRREDLERQADEA